jgi:hypothetical protein
MRADPTPQTLDTGPCILYRSIYFCIHSGIFMIAGLLQRNIQNIFAVFMNVAIRCPSAYAKLQLHGDKYK